MPPHIAILDLAGDPAEPIAISISGGEESAVSQLEIWNDKDDAFLDTTTAQDVVLKILASSSGGPYVGTGVPIIDGQWSHVRITHTLTAAGASTSGATGTLAVGTNAEFTLPDLAPQEGVRIEFYVAAPAGGVAVAVKLKLSVVGNQASTPLAQFVGLAHGSGVIPGDRVAGLRAVLRGFVVTANSTATVAIGRGLLTHDGTEVENVAENVVFTLADGGAVNLATGEDYPVTLSATSAGAIVATRGLKADANPPAAPDGNLLLGYLMVESPDGIVVTVAQASVDQAAVPYAEFLVRDGGGLSVIVSPGDGISSTSLRQHLSHGIIVALAASVTSRIWRLSDGTMVDTLTDVPPDVGADLLALVVTGAAAVTSVTDMRRLVHRALVMDRLKLCYRSVMSQVATPARALDLEIANFDCEIESVELNLTGTDVLWTGGSIIVDVMTFAPGAAVPYPAGGAGGVSLFTSSATDDARPSIAWNATDLRSISVDHELRRIVAGTRLTLTIVGTVTASAPELDQEIRVTLHVRRYR